MPTISNECAACGRVYHDHPERIGNPGFCSLDCRRSEEATEARFLARIHKDQNGCWIWQGSVNRQGYGRFSGGGGYEFAHRYAHERFIGPLHKGQHVDHLCKVVACCNPNHLEAVSPHENIMRSDAPTAKNARKTHCKRGHQFTKGNTYIYPDGRRRCKTCRRIQDMKEGPRIRRMMYKRKMRSEGRL